MISRILTSIPRAIRTIRRLSADLLNSDLTFQQFRILNLVNEGMGQTQMSQNLQVSMAAISKIVDLLVKRGLLKRETGEDRRCLTLSLTTEGKKVLKCVKTQVEKKIEIHYKKLTEKEKSELEKGLIVLDKLVGYLNEN